MVDRNIKTFDKLNTEELFAVQNTPSFNTVFNSKYGLTALHRDRISHVLPARHKMPSPRLRAKPALLLIDNRLYGGYSSLAR